MTTNYYTIAQALEKKGIKIKYETIDQYLSRGGKITDVTGQKSQFEDIQRKMWYRPSGKMRPGNGKNQWKETVRLVDECI